MIYGRSWKCGLKRSNKNKIKNGNFFAAYKNKWSAPLFRMSVHK
jgi:hypothetical protein